MPHGRPMTKKFTMMMFPAMRKMLARVAAHHRRTASDWVRQAIRDEYDRIRREAKEGEV